VHNSENGRLHVKGEHCLPLTRDAVWEALNNPEILQQCIKGCDTVERIDKNHFEAIFKLKVGPIKRQFNAKLEIDDDQTPEKYFFNAELNAGIVGNVHGKTRVKLIQEYDHTYLKYNADIMITGWFKSLGTALLNKVADKYMLCFIEKLIDLAEYKEDRVAI